MNGHNMKPLFLFTIAIMMANTLTGCQQELSEERNDSDTYYASMETFESSTKTFLSDEKYVVWSPEDRIAIFRKDRKGKGYQIIDSFAGSSSGEFIPIEGLQTLSSSETIDGTIAIYPFNENLRIHAAKNNSYQIRGITFASEQTYLRESYSDESLPMVALSTDGSNCLSFKNIGGIIKLSITGSSAISRIVIEGNSGEILAGSAIVNIDSDGIPTTRMEEDASKSVTLLCNPAVELDSSKATDFYISIPPTKFEKGFKVTITDSEGNNAKKVTVKENPIHRSIIRSMQSFLFESLEFLESGELWVDLGLSVKWANHNIGANSPEGFGEPYAWGETDSKTTFSGTNYNCWDIPEENISGTIYDVAHTKWGDGARIPTKEEFQELIDNCSSRYGRYKGIYGNYITGKNGKQIFIPTTDRKGHSVSGLWSATKGGGEDLNNAYYYYVNGTDPTMGYRRRYYGFSIRPVRNSKN